MITIALYNEAKRIKGALNKNANSKWCYIGKDVLKREKINNLLGEEKRFYFKERLYRIAEELRQPYLDFVAKIGKKQTDQLNWWASRFASKSLFQIDFFLLVCYKVLVMRLIEETDNEDTLAIFIEDPWFFSDIKDITKNKNNITFLGHPYILSNKFLYIIRGVIYRLSLALWFVVARTLIYYHHKGKNPQILEVENSTVAILSPAEARSFKDGQYIDNFMPRLADFYKKNKIPFFYLYYLPFELSTAKYVGQNRQILWPLIIDSKLLSMLKRIFEYWKPNDALNDIDTYNVSMLLQREKYIEFSSVGFNLKLILFDALNHFFNKKWCHSIIYLFENQPWEKMLCMSASKNGVKAIGYQHSTIWRLFLSQFAGKNEASIMPLPYKIVTTGSYSAQLYKDGGMPEDKIMVGGAWRYFHLFHSAKNDNFVKRDRNFKPIILVSLPVDISISNSMLKGISEAISKNNLAKNIQLWIKPHPGVPLSNLKILSKLPFYGCRIVNKSFNELLKDADVVISSASASGLEAYLYGKKVISYSPENLLAADPLLDIIDKNVYKWYEGEDLNIDFLKDFSSAPNSQDMEQIKKKYFAEINHELWLNLLTSKN